MAKLKLLLLSLWAIFMPNLLQKHVTAQSQVMAYRITSTSTGRGTTTVTEAQIKDNKFYLRTSEFIAIDNTMYYTDSDGSLKSKVMDVATLNQYNRFRPTWVAQNLHDNLTKSTFKKIGTEKCGELTCYKYEQTDSADPDAKRVFWFDTKKYLLRKDVFTSGEFSSENTYSYDNIDIQTSN